MTAWVSIIAQGRGIVHYCAKHSLLTVSSFESEFADEGLRHSLSKERGAIRAIVQRAPCTTEKRGPKCGESAAARADAKGRGQLAYVDMGWQLACADMGRAEANTRQGVHRQRPA